MEQTTAIVLELNSLVLFSPRCIPDIEIQQGIRMLANINLVREES
jgi:hypothetical protein